MAAIASPSKVNVTIQLNNGTVDGIVRTLSVPLGQLDLTDYDDTKALNIANLLGECLEKPIYRVQKSVVYTLSNE